MSNQPLAQNPFMLNISPFSEPENQIDKKLQQRQELFTSEANYTQLKENAISSDLTLGSDERAKMFKNRRRVQKLNIQTTLSLKDNISVPLDLYKDCQSMQIKPDEIHKCIELFNTNEIPLKFRGLVGLRMLLSLPTNPPIQEMIDFGIVSGLISLLDTPSPEFQYEALWCLTNIASGTSEQSNAIVVKGGLEKIIRLMDSNIEELQNQATWLLGNLAGDSTRVRDQIIAQKGFDKLLTTFATTIRPQLMKHSMWAISNFCRVKPILPYDMIIKAIDPIIKAFNLLSDDKEFLTDACWVLSYLTENYKKSIKELIDAKILPKVFKCLEIDSKVIQISCLRIVGNIASGNANQTQLLIDYGVLSYLKRTLHHESKNIRKETAWILSNIAAGTQRQIEILINEGFLPLLSERIQKDLPEIRKEAIWAVCNLTSIEKKELMEVIIKQQIIEIICECLKLKDAKYLAVSLEALGNLLAFGKKYLMQNDENLIVKRVEQLGMFEVLESLQYHPVEVVYEKTIKLLETFFDTENTQ